ncbi:MAG: NAD-dependent epimerase/dehydratase family protein [Polyangiaceae bacterium]
MNAPVRKILLTGSSGFVGTAVRARFAERGVAVRSVTRRGTGDGTSFAIATLDETTCWDGAWDGVDAVVHLAAKVHAMDEQGSEHLETYRKVNVRGTIHLAREAAKAGVKRFVHVSSVKAAGESSTTSADGSPVPLTEATGTRPEDPYGLSKYEAEIALRDLSGTTGLEVCILRPPLVYGAGVRANFLSLLRLAASGVPLPIASIDNRRSMVFVKNLADAIAVATTSPAAPGKTFFVADEPPVSTATLVRSMREALRIPARLVPVPPRALRTVGAFLGKGAALDRLTGSLVVDTTAIRRELGWVPPFTMSDGLRETVAWFVERRG